MRVTSQFPDCRAVRSLYNAYVRSTLEYGAIAWDPREKYYEMMVERVQRKYAREIYRRMYGYYPYLYPSLFVSGMVGLDTLNFRRKLLLMMHYYSVLNNEIDNPAALGMMSLAVPCRHNRGLGYTATPRRRDPTFSLSSAIRTKHASNAPTARALAMLNELVTELPDVDIFADCELAFLKQTRVFLNRKI